MYSQTADGVQPAIAMLDLAFIVLRLLVVNENLQVVEVFRTVVAPWSFEQVF